MTGRITALSGNTVIINGETYAFTEATRYVLELAARDGCEVEFVVREGAIKCVMRVPKVGAL